MSSTNLKNITGDRIRALRNALNISAESFSRRCNITARYLLCVEEGRYPVTENLLNTITSEFSVPESWLTEETEKLNISNIEESPVERLKQIFDDSGLSQREFCRKAGTSNASLSCVLSGKQKFTEGFAKKVESAFGVGADWLLYGDESAKDYPLSREMVRFLKDNPEERKRVWERMCASKEDRIVS